MEIDIRDLTRNLRAVLARMEKKIPEGQMRYNSEYLIQLDKNYHAVVLLYRDEWISEDVKEILIERIITEMALHIWNSSDIRTIKMQKRKPMGYFKGLIPDRSKITPGKRKKIKIG